MIFYSKISISSANGPGTGLVTSSKYLGITVDSKLSWRGHINNVTSKSCKALGMAKRTLGPCSREVKELEYSSLVWPKLEYGSVAWNPHSQHSVDKLQRVQMAAARFVMNDHRRSTSVSDLLNTLNWKSLESRRLHSQLSMLHKIKNGLVHITVPPHLLLPRHLTRNHDPNKYIQVLCRTNI